MAYTFVMMICLRSHYSIDMIAGLIIAHYIWIMMDKYISYFDYNFLGIPLEKRLATID